MADIEYYLSLNSPWTYLGHARLLEMAARHGCAIQARLVDFGVVFPATGGLPVPRRSPQRQAYRLAELQRWRSYLAVPLELHPKHWPADNLLVSSMVHAALAEDAQSGLALAGAVMRSVWAQERDIANRATIVDIGAACGLDAERLLADPLARDFPATRQATSEAAIERGVFGAPTYIYRDELFWGQDRLDFLERALRSA